MRTGHDPTTAAVSDCTHSDSDPIRMARHERKVKDTIYV